MAVRTDEERLCACLELQEVWSPEDEVVFCRSAHLHLLRGRSAQCQ